MLQRVELSYFKNHCNTVVDFNSPFNVVVGRNGSGKSAVLDAIEWCLFHSKGKDIRALSHKDLVNKSKPPHEVMSVQIELLDVNNNTVIQLRREYNGTRSQMYTRRGANSNKLASSELQQPLIKISPKQLHDILDELHIPFTNLNRILIKQNATSIASASSKHLLTYIESIVGTDTIKAKMDNMSKQLDEMLVQQTKASGEYAAAVTRKNDCRPQLLNLLTLYSDLNSQHLKWMELLNLKRKSLKWTEVTMVEKLKIRESNASLLEENFRSQDELKEEAAATVKSLQSRQATLQQLKRQTQRHLRNQLTEHSKQQLLKAAAEELKNALNTSIRIKTKKMLRLKKAVESSPRIKEAQENISQIKLKLKVDEQKFCEHLQSVLILVPSDVKNNSSYPASHYLQLAKNNLASYLERQLQLQDLLEEIETLQSQNNQVPAPTSSKSSSYGCKFSHDSKNQLALQKKKAANEKLAQATNDCSEALSALNETKTQINRQRTQVKRLKLENQTQDHKQNSQSLNKDRRPRSKLDDLLYSRYCYCKALLADLRATATSPENQIRNKTVVVCGMLVDHLQLAGNEYSTAVKTVLGDSLASTIVVGTRQEAVHLSVLASHPSRESEFKPNINIHIVDELSVVSKSQTITNKGVNTVIPLLEVVHTTSDGYERVLYKKLHNWHLYRSFDYEQLSKPENKAGWGDSQNKTSTYLTQFQQKKVNLVTLKGQIFLADGEVRSSSLFSSTTQPSNYKEDVLDALMRHDTRMMANLSDENRTSLMQSPQATDRSSIAQTQTSTKAQFKTIISDLHRLEKTHKKQVQQHLDAQVNLEICKQSQQHVHDKWRLFDQEKYDLLKKQSSNPVVNHVSQKGPACKISNKAVLLLEELTNQYALQKQNLEKQFHCLKIQFEADNGTINYTLKFLANLLKTGNEIKRMTASIKRQEQEQRRQHSELTTTAAALASLNTEYAKVLIDVKSAAKKQAEANEHINMLQEDVYGLSDKCEQENEIAVTAKQSLRELSLSVKRLDRAQSEAQREIRDISSKRNSIHAQLKESGKHLKTRQEKETRTASQAQLYQNALDQDIFMSTTLRVLTATEVTKVLADTNQWPSPDFSSLEQTGSSETKESEITNGDAVACENIDLKHLIAKESQFASSELLLQQQLDEAEHALRLLQEKNSSGGIEPAETWFSFFRVLMLQCSRHRQCYYSILQQGLNLRAELHSLSENRFCTLLSALDRINEKLDPLYSAIVPSGSCYLDYPRDKVSLFEMGIQPKQSRNAYHAQDDKTGGGIRLRARHGGDCIFREVQGLSGGQTAAVGLALLVSLQECYPSPFVIMDEVDAALDTSTSCRVGCLLRRRSCRGIRGDIIDELKQAPQDKDKALAAVTSPKANKSQFTVVSHRPEMQIWADQIVGVYFCRGFPTAVSICFDNDVENDVDHNMMDFL